MAVAMFRHEERHDYTYRDYLNMPDDGNRWEIIHGVPYMMEVPSFLHQWILGELLNKFYNFLEDRRCCALPAPLDLRLPLYGENDEDTTNIVQPDISVYCNFKNLDEIGRILPTLVVEIMSPSSAKMDRYRKHRLYQLAGIPEYWLVDPKDELIEVFVHDGKTYKRKAFYDAQNDAYSVAISTALPGFEVAVAEIFPGEELTNGN